MCLLTFHTAISHEIARVASFQFDVINSGDAAGSTVHDLFRRINIICITVHNEKSRLLLTTYNANCAKYALCWVVVGGRG
mmetsp:Transcript_15611/g.24224  ORF Transcript_15611/g.24224 Transcript_15611/m.24224 type:complete len:80 (+) Transcript_15611:112-351(+)